MTLRRGGLLLAIIVLPLTVLIFGVAAANAAVAGPVPFGTQFMALCALTLASLVIGRFAAAGVTFLVGAGVERFHSIGIPIALTSIAFIAGLALVPFGVETKGQPLP